MAEPSAAANAPAIRILHEDDHIVVVDKPTNLLSVPGRHPDAPPPTKKRRRVAEFWVEALEASRASSPPESLAAKLLGVKVGEADKVVLKAAYKKAALRDAAPRRARATQETRTHP